MKRKIIKTADGSHTIHLEDWNEQYHSKHGAIQEAYHVFIKSGLAHCDKTDVSILEVGFGTGLNAIITLLESQKSSLNISYVGVEKYPVAWEEARLLNYIEQLNEAYLGSQFEKMHACTWEEETIITPNFKLLKRQKDFIDIDNENQFDLVYFDAFGARVQPELWTEEIFEIMYKGMKKSGILVTYAAKGSVRRAMQAVGFEVERLPGPPGKREMLRATKL
ncbi:tRNA (5-methylaminomethyl-2-thiouridine)(34)-methyltransferase MnmD [Spongiivirga citrea]|uniref:tRNA (5-methylaminomethyl-2-thiouridine)(34)-methyltransferase MnmD n=1 Tax=Spongiivirga citrea TaxID=1481457 RepID=A0A6M0CKT3_9FLAO|nr:tRNA (5-methylaminomethyl-2-thiouridine)(34)-methyltransferase MnmD [Spongiivirga citrea]NER18565.1 tRNA (5-methylaminomethyl-2-thiouridine)(34)-methyltransferase MnmD [Spongiivirga citrea]